MQLTLNRPYGFLFSVAVTRWMQKYLQMLGVLDTAITIMRPGDEAYFLVMGDQIKGDRRYVMYWLTYERFVTLLVRGLTHDQEYTLPLGTEEPFETFVTPP